MMQEIDLIIKQRVHERDGWKCRVCGKTDDLQAAHIKSKGRYGRIRFEELNVITLCRRHHIYWQHKDGEEFKEWLEKQQPGIYQQLEVMAGAAAKVDLKLLLTVLRAEAARA